MPLAFHDGQFVDSGSITISPLDFGFARGAALFDFARVYGGVPFRLDDHIERLLRGAEVIGLTCPYSPSEITQAARHLTAQNKFPHSGLKFYLTAGECSRMDGAFGFAGCRDFTPHFMLIEEAVDPKHPEAPKGVELNRRGLSLKTVPFAREIADAKVTNYLLGFRAARQLAGPDCDEILFTHRDGYVTESPTSNFFCVIDGVLCTPGRGMLRGVTRKVILELAERLGVPRQVRDLTKDDLRRASEAFITGSFIEMVPVHRIDDIAFTVTTDAPVYAKLRKALTEEISQSR